jgi:arylsulfatase A-like enzyme
MLPFKSRAAQGPRLLTLLTCLGALLAACGRAPAPRPNIVVVLLDTLRPDHLGLHGYPRDTAPFLTEFASRGAVFENAFSTSAWTLPATASLFTGHYPTRHGLVNGFEANEWMAARLKRSETVQQEVAQLPVDHPTLAQRLQDAGYRTFAFTTNTHVSSDFGFERGFDGFRLERNQKAKDVVDWLIEHAGEVRRPAEPYFLYVHLNDVHRPYEPRAPWYTPGADARTEQIARYDSEISYLDQELARLAEVYRWDENTLVCLVSDHGEAFLEHGTYGHGTSLYAELNRVLMVFVGPGIAPGRIRTSTSLADVAPTLLGFAGLPAESMDGVRLCALLAEGSRAGEEARLAQRFIFAHRLGVESVDLDAEITPKDLWSVQQGTWRLIHDGLEGRTRLFDHARDPGEELDLYAAEPERARGLEQALEEFQRTSRRSQGQLTSVPIDAELFQDLADMGYVGGDG